MTPPIHVGLAQHPIKKGAGGVVSHNVTDFEWLIIIYTWIHYFFFTHYTQSHHNLAKNDIKSLVILKFFKKNLINSTLWVFWPNIAKFGVYLRYRHCSKLFRELRKESEFRQLCCRQLPKFNKSMREKEKRWERENFEFW